MPYADYEVASVRTVLGTIFRTATSIENAAKNVRDHWGGLPAHLSGSPVSTTGYYSAMTERTRSADELAQMLRSMWKALDAYADDAETPLRNLVRLREEAAEWQSRRPTEVMASPDTPLQDLWAMQAGYAPGTVCMAQSPWTTWNAERSRIKADVAYWAGEYERIADVCAAALRHIKDPTLTSWWGHMSGLIASRNFADFGLTGEQLAIYEAVTLTTRLANGELDEAGMARLEQLLSELNANPEAASAFWITVGGERTRELFWQLGEDIPFEAGETSSSLSLAMAARESLATASNAWSTSEAEEFVNALTTHSRTDTTMVVALDVVGFLFADPAQALMGASFATAMATRLDTAERHPDSFYRGDPVFHLGGVNSLLRQASFGEGPAEVNNAGVYDPMAKVLETLGHHPNEALAWLTDGSADPHTVGTTGEARVKHWFGECEWSDDGWTGAAKLWEGAMLADGGVHSGTTTGEAYLQQAELTAQIIRELGERDSASFRPDDLTDNAAMSMARALSAELAGLVETTVAADHEARASSVENLQFFETGTELPMPIAVLDDLARVWGTVGGERPRARYPCGGSL